MAAGAVIIALLAWFLPAIVAHTPLLGFVIHWLARDLKGEILVRSASLGWLSPPRFTEVEVRDERNQRILTAASLVGEKSLLAILAHSSHLGRFHCEKPQGNLVLREGGSNLEDVLVGYLSSGPPGFRPDVVVDGADGALTVTNARTGQSWQVASWGLVFEMSNDRASHLAIKTSGELAEGGGGKFDGRVKIGLSTGDTGAKPTSDVPVFPAEEFALEAEDLPLEMLEPLAARFALGARLAGRLCASIHCGPAGGVPGKIVIQGNAKADDLALSAPAMGNDQVRLGRFYTACQMAWQGDRVEVERLLAECDAANAQLAGTFQLAGASTAEIVKSLGQQSCQISGQADLARLADMLPETLHIKKDTRITSGEVRLSLTSKREAQGMTWQGHAGAARLIAIRQGQQFSWQQPIVIDFAARQTPQGPVMDVLECRSDFFQLQASGTTDQWEATASLQLSRLAEQLAGFVDLAGLRMAGDGGARLHWRRTSAQQFEAQGEIHASKFQLAFPGRPEWNEESVRLVVSAAGKTDSRAAASLDLASLQLQAGPDSGSIRLRQPVADLRGGAWPLQVEIKGDLSAWTPRLVWAGLEGWRLRGTYELDGEASYATDRMELSRGRLVVQGLEIGLNDVSLREPNSELIVSGGRWQPSRRRLELDSLTLQGQSLAAQANRLVVGLSAAGPAELGGAVRWQGLLERMLGPGESSIVAESRRELARSVRSTLGEPEVTPSPLVGPVANGTTAPLSWQLAGQFIGQASCEPAVEGTSLMVDSTVSNLALVHASGQTWREPSVRLVARGCYRPQSRFLDIQRAELRSTPLGLVVEGRCSLAGARPDLQLAGTMEYDLEKLSGMVRARVGDGMYVNGRGTSPVSYRGPFDLAAAQGRAAMTWTWADIYGFQVGPGKLEAGLANGVLAVEPLDLDVSEGRVHIAPQLRFLPQAAELYIPAGKLADRVRINPRMCAGALQYAAPVLAGVASVEGRFSVELDACRIPLGRPSTGDLAGRMTVHAVQIGPGPLTEQLAQVVGRSEAAQLKRESTIAFQMAEGRIYHRDLELEFPDVTVWTYGSVGLDQSLAIMTEMPIPPKWLGKNQVVNTALANQVIRLPVGGTLRKPAVDRRELERQSGQLVGSAAQNVLEKELYKGLDRLFRSPQ